MPKMVLNRNHTISTTLGHVVRFRKGEETDVPKEVVSLALSIGAELLDAAALADVQPVEEVKAALPEGDERETAIFKAIATLEERNEREDFSGSGAPNLDALKGLLGFKVDKVERNNLWNRYQEMKAESAQA